MWMGSEAHEAYSRHWGRKLNTYKKPKGTPRSINSFFIVYIQKGRKNNYSTRTEMIN